MNDQHTPPPAPESSAIELIAREVLGKVSGEIGRRLDQAVDAATERAEQIAARRLDEALAAAPAVAERAAERAQPARIEPAPADPKTDAKDRAWRTLLQGIVVTVVLAVVTAFGTAVSAENFELLDWGSWRAAATAAGSAAAMAIVAYIQRLINPPKNTVTRP